MLMQHKCKNSCKYNIQIHLYNDSPYVVARNRSSPVLEGVQFDLHPSIFFKWTVRNKSGLNVWDIIGGDFDSALVHPKIF
jgi:hypothetical protein